MTTTRIRNATRGVELANVAEVAASIWQRFVGLMGHDALPAGGGLVLRPCNSVHMFFMRQALDVVYLDREGRVVRLVENLKPWRVGPIVGAAHCVLELPVGVIAATGTRVGDAIEIDDATV